MAQIFAELNDAELLRLMLAGDAGAFAALYERRQGGVYRFALRMSGSETLAEDVTQDVFLALMRDGSQFDATRGSLTAYLYGIARNRVLRLLSRDKIFSPLLDERDEDGWEHNFAATDDPLADLSRRETVDNVRQAVLALPLHYRELVVLCYLQETTYEDAARITGCAIGTVRSRLSRGRALLLEKLRALQPKEAPARLTLVTRLAL
jgi:RNA polymerase sigma-70 factor (ECF subfamily)